MRFFNNVKTALLLGSMIGLCMLVGHLAGGPRGVLFGLMFGGIGNLIAFFYSDKIALMSMQARELPEGELPWLHNMIARLAERAGLPKPRIYICPQPAPNAFATGRSPSKAVVAITEGMLQNFPQAEIEGVMAHEMSHVKHRDMLISTLAAVMAGIISYAGYMLMWFGGGSRNSENQSPLGAIGAIAMIILAPIAAMLIQLAISRQREYAADSYGGELCGDPLKLASALRRLGHLNERIPTDTPPAFHNLYIVEPLAAHGGNGMASLFATHPPLEKRIALLEQQAMRMR